MIECYCGYQAVLEVELQDHVLESHPQEFRELADQVLEEVVSEKADEFIKRHGGH